MNAEGCVDFFRKARDGVHFLCGLQVSHESAVHMLALTLCGEFRTECDRHTLVAPSGRVQSERLQRSPALLCFVQHGALGMATINELVWFA